MQAKPVPVKFEYGGCCAPFRGDLDLHLTQCGQGRGLHACQVLIHLDPSNRLATVHQCHRQKGQRTDSIGRTVLQTVAQKS